jgi:hypothetical protein
MTAARHPPGAVRHSGSSVSEKPPCWDDRSCNTPVACYLHGCKRTGYQNSERVPDANTGRPPIVGEGIPTAGPDGIDIGATS